MRFFALLVFLFSVVSCEMNNDQVLKADLETATKLSQEFIIVDTHIDLPMRFYYGKESMQRIMETGNLDYERAVKGGLDAPFMSIFVPARTEMNGAKKMADSLITLVEKLTNKFPDKFAIAMSPSDVRKNFEKGLISLPLGMENGAPIEGKLENLDHFAKRGISYITLTHSESNHICDSSYDPERKWNGLSPFGYQVIEEMNKLGIMIDVSHITDSTFYQVMRATKVPVIASHSSCRKFTPGWERNMDDEMIRALAVNGGVIQINFGSSFLDDGYRLKSDSAFAEIKDLNLRWGTPKFEAFITEYKKKHNVMEVDVSVVAAHIDHVVKLVGIDHVGLGSDFDGVGDSLPVGLKDVSGYPNLILELLRLGYSEKDIEKICSGNLLRVWQQVKDYSVKS